MLKIINKPSDFFNYGSDLADPILLKNGYTLYLKNGETDVFKRIPYIDGKPQCGLLAGYSFVANVAPNCGYSNSGSELMQSDDAKLIAISESLGLGWTDGSGNVIPFNYNTAKEYIAYPSVANVEANYINRLFINRINQDIGTQVITYNNKYYLRDNASKEDVQIKNTPIMTFDGTQSVECGSMGSLSDFTIRIRFNSSAVENYRNIYDTNFGGGTDTLRIEQNTSGNLKIIIGDGITSSAITYLSGLIVNTDYEFIVSYNGTKLTTYLNGLKNGVNVTLNPINFTNLFVGKGFADSRRFKGDISLFEIWDEYIEQRVPKTTPILRYGFQEMNEDIVYNSISDNNNGIIEGYNASMRTKFSDNSDPLLLRYGYEVYELDSNPNVKDDYIYIIANIDGTFKSPTKAGYSLKYSVPANSGFSDVFNTYENINNELAKTYEEVKDFINSIPSKEDFQIDNSGDCIKKMAVG